MEAGAGGGAESRDSFGKLQMGRVPGPYLRRRIQNNIPWKVGRGEETRSFAAWLRLLARHAIKRGRVAAGGELVFVNVGLQLRALYFPVYNKEGGYNGFTSVHSCRVITLSICKACMLVPHPGV